jgi:hypothetical protein
VKRGDLEALLEAALRRDCGEGVGPIRTAMVLSEEDRQVAASCATLAERGYRARPIQVRDPMMVLPCF